MADPSKSKAGLSAEESSVFEGLAAQDFLAVTKIQDIVQSLGPDEKIDPQVQLVNLHLPRVFRSVRVSVFYVGVVFF